MKHLKTKEVRTRSFLIKSTLVQMSTYISVPTSECLYYFLLQEKDWSPSRPTSALIKETVVSLAFCLGPKCESLSTALWLMVSADNAVMLNPLSSERLELGYTLAEQTDMAGTPSFSDDTSHCQRWLRGKEEPSTLSLNLCLLNVALGIFPLTQLSA